MQGEEKVFRRAPSWRKRFRPRDLPGGGVLTQGPLQPPPAPPKKVAPEGEWPPPRLARHLCAGCPARRRTNRRRCSAAAGSSSRDAGAPRPETATVSRSCPGLPGVTVTGVGGPGPAHGLPSPPGSTWPPAPRSLLPQVLPKPTWATNPRLTAPVSLSLSLPAHSHYLYGHMLSAFRD